MTLSETFRADLEWPNLEGVILDGGYELKQALAHTPAAATFAVRVLGGAGLEATARFHRANAVQASEQLALWELLRELPHRNVTAPLAAGRKSVDGHQTVYVVLGIPDDRLSALAGERALTEDEAREVLRSVAGGLGHLHANGLAHGCVSPGTILGNGDSIQLAGECVRKLNYKPVLELIEAPYVAPECDAFQSTASADVWCLGATLFEMLAQKPYQAEAKDAKADLAGLPLAPLLRRCLAKDPDKRATLTEVVAILEKGPSAALDIAEDDIAEKDVAGEGSAAAPDSGVERPTEHPVKSAPLEAGQVETRADGTDPLEVPVIQAPLPPKQVTSEVGLEEKPSPEVISPEADEQSLPIAAAVPVEARHRPMRTKRQPVGARFLPLKSSEQSEQDVAAPTIAKVAPPVKPRRGIGIRLKAGPGTWRGLVAGAAVVLMVGAVVWQVIIPRLQIELQSAGLRRGASPAKHADGSAWLTRTLPAGDGTLPDARRKSALKDAPDDASGAIASTGRAWRVILYAYEHQSDAERRVELVNHNHPGLGAHLFVADNGGPYLVVTGDATDQEHAEALRKRALQLGVPHATVQEFTQ
jgi:protein kinase-like protein